MRGRAEVTPGLGPLGAVLAGAMVLALALPFVALAGSSSIAELRAAVAHPMFGPALGLSLRSSLVSLTLIVVMGTPLAWWLATREGRWPATVGVLVRLPVVIPPAVVGVALLQTYGRQGVLGAPLAAMGITIPFSGAAVVLAQVVVAAPFYVQAAANAFRQVDPDTLVVARTLGASRAGALLRVAMPAAMPGLVAGATLAWARALGEFGATLLFAGNLGGRTQTMPLAIFSALEADVRLAVAFSVVLAGGCALLLLGVGRAASPRRDGAGAT